MYRFTEEEFLESVANSKSHKEAKRNLGYRNPCLRRNESCKYSELFFKLQPNISHFVKIKPNSITKIKYIGKSKEYRSEYAKIRYKNNIQYRLCSLLRNRLRMALKNNQKNGSAVSDLGCSIEKFKLWLEMHFQEGMSWNNQVLWHIDHIKPLSSFDLTNRSELLEACHFTNLQPLWKIDNLQKSNKF